MNIDILQRYLQYVNNITVDPYYIEGWVAPSKRPYVIRKVNKLHEIICHDADAADLLTNSLKWYSLGFHVSKMSILHLSNKHL